MTFEKYKKLDPISRTKQRLVGLTEVLCAMELEPFSSQEAMEIFEEQQAVSLTRMCGVVLWSDAGDHKAVVWCEDAGNLAYYIDHDGSSTSEVALDAGDLIEFDLVEGTFRQVKNPVHIDPELCVELPRTEQFNARHHGDGKSAEVSIRIDQFGEVLEFMSQHQKAG